MRARLYWCKRKRERGPEDPSPPPFSRAKRWGVGTKRKGTGGFNASVSVLARNHGVLLQDLREVEFFSFIFFARPTVQAPETSSACSLALAVSIVVVVGASFTVPTTDIVQHLINFSTKPFNRLICQSPLSYCVGGICTSRSPRRNFLPTTSTPARGFRVDGSLVSSRRETDARGHVLQ